MASLGLGMSRIAAIGLAAVVMAGCASTPKESAEVPPPCKGPRVDLGIQHELGRSGMGGLSVVMGSFLIDRAVRATRRATGQCIPKHQHPDPYGRKRAADASGGG